MINFAKYNVKLKKKSAYTVASFKSVDLNAGCSILAGSIVTVDTVNVIIPRGQMVDEYDFSDETEYSQEWEFTQEP